MKPGVKASDIHKIVVDIVRQKYDMHYTRGNVGHGVGVELYDEPELRIDNQQKLIPGMTISVEAPYHKFGLGGFIVEESVLVTEDGHEVVSDISKELFLDLDTAEKTWKQFLPAVFSHVAPFWDALALKN